MTPEVAAAMERIRRGASGPADMAILQRALFGLAPSSPEYREISAVLGQGSAAGSVPVAPTFESSPIPSGPSGDPTAARTQQPEFDWDAINPFAGRGTPTLDWAAGGTQGGPAPTGQQPTGAAWEVTPLESGMGGLAAQSQAGMLGQGGISAGTSPRLPPEVESLSGVERAMFDMQKRQQEAGGGNRLNTDVQGGHQGGWQGIPFSAPPQPDESVPLVVDPGGNYTFSGATPQGVDLLTQNQGAYLNQYAAAKGGGANMAAFLQSPYIAADMLSRYGVLGGAGTADLFGGANKGAYERQADIEEFLNSYNQQGMAANPGAMNRQILDRANATEWATTVNPDTQLAYTPDQIIDVTNEAMLTSAMFLSPEGVDWMKAVLESAKQEYIKKVASGEVNTDTLSYPAYLKQLGYDTLLG
jgi:hypothetical protein